MAHQAKQQSAVVESPTQLSNLIQVVRLLCKMTGNPQIIAASKGLEQAIQTAIKTEHKPSTCWLN